MNDDFLRRAWRQPRAAFEHQLRERLRQQELASPPRRRPTWGLLIVSVLVGGSALAAVTYLTGKHWQWLSSSTSEIQRLPAAGAPVAQSGANPQAAFDTSPPTAATSVADWLSPSTTPRENQDSLVSATRDEDRPSVDSTPAGVQSSEVSSSTGAASATAASVRIALTPELAVLNGDLANRFTYRGMSPRAEITSPDAAFAVLCTDASPPLDIVIASRRINQEEMERCKKQGVSKLSEAKLGHMAVVLTRAKSGSRMQLSADTILRALLKRIPSPHDPSRLIDNPYTDWNQIDRSLEVRHIDVLGPPRDSQHFLVFAATTLEPACDRYSWIRALRTTDRSAYQEICHSLREDGVYKDATWDNTFVGQRLWADPNSVAVIDYSFYSANSTDLLGSLLTGPAPTSSSIMDGSYPGARTVHLYVSTVRYVHLPAVSSFLDDYLRRQDYTGHRWLIPPEGANDSRRYFRALPLTEIKLE